MVDYQIVPASILHVKPMVARIRTASYIGLQAFGLNPRQALHRVFIKSFYSRTAIIDGQPVAMWGVAGTILGDCGEPWLVLSQQVTDMPVAIVREARHELKSMMNERETLVVNMIPDDDEALRFALHLGFSDGKGGTRREMEDRIKTDLAARIPVGDSYVIPLTYAAGGF